MQLRSFVWVTFDLKPRETFLFACFYVFMSVFKRHHMNDRMESSLFIEVMAYKSHKNRLNTK